MFVTSVYVLGAIYGAMFIGAAWLASLADIDRTLIFWAGVALFGGVNGFINFLVSLVSTEKLLSVLLAFVGAVSTIAGFSSLILLKYGLEVAVDYSAAAFIMSAATIVILTLYTRHAPLNARDLS